jgi:hypothetical protein
MAGLFAEDGFRSKTAAVRTASAQNAALAMTPEQRSEWARKAVAAREARRKAGKKT